MMGLAAVHCWVQIVVLTGSLTACEVGRHEESSRGVLLSPVTLTTALQGLPVTPVTLTTALQGLPLTPVTLTTVLQACHSLP